MYNALDKCLIRDRNLAIGFFNLAIYNFKCRNYVGKNLKKSSFTVMLVIIILVT